MAFLNSSIIPLLIEIDGITNLGEGAVYTNVYWLKLLKVPTHESISNKRVHSVVEKLKNHKVLSIFDELAANTPEEVSIEKVKPIRRELDKIIMGDILGLTEDEQLEVYRAVVDLVSSRIEKAKSVKKKGRTTEGVDIEMMTKTIKERLGDKLLGNFYREKILTQKNLKTVKLFSPTKDIEIRKDFLKGSGWLLSSGKDIIECDSEVEAEYIKIWLESGLEKIKVPRDETYLSKILPELKALKERIDQIISEHIFSITSQKLQRRILQKLQGELF